MPNHSPSPLPIRDTLRGRRILLTGASGFLGQVWLAMLLSRLPEIGRIFVLLRPKEDESAAQRFEAIVNHSPVFGPLHERYDAELSELISRRVEVLEGDTGEPELGLDDATTARLHGELDLVVHCAGLVDFNPDLRKAIATNVDGTLRVAELTRACDDAALLHVSTCYVAGSRQGLVREALTPTKAPNGESFDPRAEYAQLQADIAAGCAALADDEAQAEIAERVKNGMEKRGIPAELTAVADNLRKGYQERWLKERMRNLGIARASHWGFRNIYTFTKFLAEGLLLDEAGDLRLAIFRPATIESALSFPFPGWNQGLNTTAPTVHLGGTWFRFFPTRRAHVFDIIPVDLACNAMTTVAAALLRDEHAPVYQIGTSTRNPITMGRIVDLSTLGHRRWLRREGDSFLDRQIRSRWDTVVVEPDHFLRMGNLARGAGLVEKLMRRLPAGLPEPVRSVTEQVEAMAKNSGYVFDQIDKLLTAFGPFIYDDHYVFESIAIDAHSPLEPEFDFAAEALDWRHYWIEIHMPGLRQWAWPIIYGQEIEPYQPQHRFVLAAPEKGGDVIDRPPSSTRDAARPQQRA